VRFYRWNYAWQTIKGLYIQKQHEIADRTNAFCEFLVELVSAAVGGGKGSKEEVTLDTGEFMEELTDEQIAEWKNLMGEQEFARMYPDYA